MNYLILSAILALGALPAGAEQGPDDRTRPDMAAMRNQEADDLALLLGLSAAQRPALDAFLQADRPPTPPRDDEWGSRRGGPPTFGRDLARREVADAEHAGRDRARLGAAHTFYAQLDQRQKLAFDALMRLRRAPGWSGPGHPGA